jgi:hypothetical protein
MSKPRIPEYSSNMWYVFYSFSQYQQGFLGQKAVYEYIILINRSSVNGLRLHSSTTVFQTSIAFV